MTYRLRETAVIAIAAVALLGGCNTTTSSSGGPLTEPVVERTFSDTLKISLPPGESPDRADGLAQLNCGRGTTPQLIDQDYEMLQFTYRCIPTRP